LNDGIYGLMFIKEHGGIALVQDPEEAEYPTLVRSAVDHVAVDQILTSDQVAAAVSRLVHEAVQNMTPEDKPADNAESFSLGLPRRPEGKLAPLVCPECGGSLWESQHGSLIRYECHEGHAFTLESLLAKQSDAIEAALWSALRVLDENVELFRRMADNAQQMGRLESSRTFQEDVRDAEERANLIRGVLLGPGSA
jgi:two-component system chemotaxis response regulator CheB